MKTIAEYITEGLLSKKTGMYKEIDPAKIKAGDRFRLKKNFDSIKDKDAIRRLNYMTKLQLSYLGSIVTVAELHTPGFLGEKGYTVYVEENSELLPAELLEKI